MKYTLFLYCVLFFTAQPDKKIEFNNPSFEGKPHESVFPSGWSSKTPDSTPDLLPGAWGLKCPSQDGKTCVGLVTREDGTSEDLGQQLGEALKSGQCYTFSIYLAHSSYYRGYDKPVRLRVWGGTGNGRKDQLLDSSPLIDHSDWKNYKFEFTPTSELRYISLEAYFGPGIFFKYKGNILLDNCSVIERCDRA
jgi:hypothetical protein